MRITPVCWAHRAQAVFARNLSSDGPGDVAADIASYKILWWYRHRCGDINRFKHRRCRLEFNQSKIHAVRFVRNPTDSYLAARVLDIV